MGAVFEGFWCVAQKTEKAKWWLAGFTTRPIAEAETKKGMPPLVCDYPQKYSKNIYERIADMIFFADAIVVAPGGPGTTQELLASLVLRDQLPEKMKQKPIIIYSPDIHADNKNSKDLY